MPCDFISGGEQVKKSHVISKFRFLEYGQPAPKGSRFKGIISISSLIGWFQYTGRDNAADTKKEKSLHEGGLLGYTSRDGKVRTFSSDGWLEKNKMKVFKEKIAKSFDKQGKIFWDTVVSLRDYEASFQSNLHDVNDYAAIVSKALPEFFRSAGFDPNNMIWWMNYHNNKHNPHMHIVFMEQVQTRTKGKLRKNVLDKYKRVWLRELGLREEFAKEHGVSSKEYLQQKDAIRKEMFSRIKIDVDDKTIQEFYSMLPKQGRLSYNSKPMKPFKKYLDQIITSLLNDKEVRPSYEEWLKKIETLDKFQNELASDNISQFKETEISKLYTQVGNLILKNVKYKNTVVKSKYNLPFLKKHILFSDDNIMRVALHDMPVSLDIPKEYVSRGDNKVYHVNLDEIDNGFEVVEKNISLGMMTGKELYDYLHDGVKPEKKRMQGTDSYETIKEENRGFVLERKIDWNEKGVELNSKEKKDPSRRTGGIRKISRNVHRENLSSVLKKGAKRILHQDEHEKEQDLEKFIREYEEQQIRINEKEMEYI